MVQFNIEEQRSLSKNIKKITNQLNKEIKYLEKNIQIYTSQDFISDMDDNSESVINYLYLQIKENMNQTIISEFFEFSKKLKLNQEIFSKKCEELVIEDDEDDKENNNIFEMNEISTTNSEINDNNVIQSKDSGENILMKEDPDFILKERDNEVDKIIKGVNSLNEMFKDMNILVNEQGTILDRIDYNIDLGYDNVVKAKKKINNANESRKGSCFRNVILFLLVFIFVESILILFKFL